MPQTEAHENIARLVESIAESELRRWVEIFSGLRHGQSNPAALEKKGELLEKHFQDVGGVARPIVVARRKQLVLWDLEMLMCSDAAVTEEDVDRIFLADPRFADYHKIVAHRMISEVEYAAQIVITTDLAADDLIQSTRHEDSF